MSPSALERINVEEVRHGEDHLVLPVSVEVGNGGGGQHMGIDQDKPEGRRDGRETEERREKSGRRSTRKCRGEKFELIEGRVTQYQTWCTS